MADGLGTCAAVQSATDSYRDEEDFIGQFIEDECDREATAMVRKADLRGAMSAWFVEHGYKPPSDRAVKADFKMRGIIEDRPDSRGSWVWCGLSLRNPVPMADRSRDWRDRQD